MQPVSLMEERARFFKKKKEQPALALLPLVPEEVERELKSLSQVLKSLSGELREARKIVADKEKKFLLLADYKYTLERAQISPTLVTLKTKKKEEKDEIDELLKALEALTPTQRENLKGIKL